MVLDILKSLLIGICASVPLGPVAILVLQKTFSKGRKAGFITGLGATLTDTTYSAIAIYALSFAQRFIDSNQEYIYTIGGLIVGVVGFFMWRSNPFRRLKTNEPQTASVRDFLQAAVMGLSNPGAVVVIFGLFAFFGMGSSIEQAGWKMIPIVMCVCLGSIFYWYALSFFISRFRKKIRLRTILWINRVTGIVVMLIGAGLVASGVRLFILAYA